MEDSRQYSVYYYKKRLLSTNLIVLIFMHNSRKNLPFIFLGAQGLKCWIKSVTKPIQE